jgi:hypothetical protein
VILHLSPVETVDREPWDPGVSAPVPSSWLEAASAWVVEHLRTGSSLRGVFGHVVTVKPDEASAFLQHTRSGLTGRLVSGDPWDPDQPIFVVETRFRHSYHHLALAGGGPAAGDDELLAIFDSLVTVARALAPDLAHARLNIEPRFDAVTTVLGDERSRAG